MLRETAPAETEEAAADEEAEEEEVRAAEEEAAADEEKEDEAGRVNERCLLRETERSIDSQRSATVSLCEKGDCERECTKAAGGGNEKESSL